MREIDYLKVLKKIERAAFKKDHIKRTPHEPGVYIFWDKEGNVNYIGKAKNLNRRLATYNLKNLFRKTKKMVDATSSFSYIKVLSEIESLILESNLIKVAQPQYNVQAKDDKNPLYILVTKEEYPRVTTARKSDMTVKGSFYGPFPSSANVRFTLNLLRRIFPFSHHAPGNRPCFYSQLNLCRPCPSYIESLQEKEYKQALRKKYLQNIKFVRMFLNGNLKRIEKDLTSQMKKLAVKEQYEEAKYFRETLEKIRYITQPVTHPEEYLANPNLVEDIRAKEIKELKDILEKYGLLTDLKRIECFDIAHLAGVATTASMVTFIDGVAEKNLYRRFKIRHGKKADDIASMTEVAKRREKHLQTWGVPDLIVVDGGKAQVNAFSAVFSMLGIPVVGLAKRFETLVIQKDSVHVQVKLKSGGAKNLLQRLRNEAHRFARRYHHLLLSKELISKTP
jgi:excinuclease ABC subunit C